jgi:peptide-methionine (S)-S-oxide reductase
MNYIRIQILVLLLLPLTVMPASAMGQHDTDIPDRPVKNVQPDEIRTAVFAGGCFWGVEGVFERVEGVWDVESGYSGGTEETARYDLVGTGTTGHAEAVQILYDPARISYKTLLKVFFTVAHDPTQLNYQGPDKGPQYRSVIFYVNDEQKRIAEEYIRTLEQSKLFSNPIVTEVVPLTAFYPAEAYHQDFLDRNPDYPYIVFWDIPKIRHLIEKYPELIAK